MFPCEIITLFCANAKLGQWAGESLDCKVSCAGRLAIELQWWRAGASRCLPDEEGLVMLSSFKGYLSILSYFRANAELDPLNAEARNS